MTDYEDRPIWSAELRGFGGCHRRGRRGASFGGEVLVEPIQRALPGILSRFFLVGVAGIVEESVGRARVDVHLVDLTGLLEHICPGIDQVWCKVWVFVPIE